MDEKTALVVVAHPDDETLWLGGTILANPGRKWTIVSLCRREDPDRAPKFFRVVERMGANGIIGDLDDGPEQAPLAASEVEAVVSSLLPGTEWDVIYSHSPFGEYTRHRRHEEVSRAVTALWCRGALVTRELLLFAYEDGGKQYLPRPIQHAHLVFGLEDDIWKGKQSLIKDYYGFEPGSWEAETAPRTEAFWQFDNPGAFEAWLAAHEDHPGEGNQ